MKIEFASQPPVGLSMAIDGQRHDLIGVVDHCCRDGRVIKLLVWEARCAECGALFQSKGRASQIAGNRRCDAHHRPGSKAVL